MDKATASDKKKVAISDAGIHKTPLLERYCRLLLLILDKLIAPVLYTVLCVAILLSFILKDIRIVGWIWCMVLGLLVVITYPAAILDYISYRQRHRQRHRQRQTNHKEKQWGRIQNLLCKTEGGKFILITAHMLYWVSGISYSIIAVITKIKADSLLVIFMVSGGVMVMYGLEYLVIRLWNKNKALT